MISYCSRWRELEDGRLRLLAGRVLETAAAVKREVGKPCGLSRRVNRKERWAGCSRPRRMS